MASNINSETHKRLILDNAVVQLNYTTTAATNLGATRGGATFMVEREYRDVEVDGTKGSVKGFKRVISESPQITATCIEYTSTMISQLIPGVSVTTATSTQTYDKITSDVNISSTNYLTDVAIVGTVSGSTVDAVCIVKNALNDGNFEMATEDQNEAETEVQFTGHYASTALSSAPWEIRYPGSSNFTT